jgi:hypothetical protein
MKSLCLAYLDRGLAPGPDVAAAYGAMGEAMRAAGVYVDSGQLSPVGASKLVSITSGEARLGGPHPRRRLRHGPGAPAPVRPPQLSAGT